MIKTATLPNSTHTMGYGYTQYANYIINRSTSGNPHDSTYMYNVISTLTYICYAC